MTKVAFIGTGLLGSGMVEAMLRRGVDVRVWNRTTSKADALRTLGATVAPTPEDAIRDVELVHLALSDDSIVDEMVLRIGPRLDSAVTVIEP